MEWQGHAGRWHNGRLKFEVDNIFKMIIYARDAPIEMSILS